MRAVEGWHKKRALSQNNATVPRCHSLPAPVTKSPLKPTLEQPRSPCWPCCTFFHSRPSIIQLWLSGASQISFLPGGYSCCYSSWVVAHRVRVGTENLVFFFSVLPWAVTVLCGVIIVTLYQHEDFTQLARTVRIFVLVVRKILVNECNSTSTREGYWSHSRARVKTIIRVITVLNNPRRGTEGDRTGIPTSPATKHLLLILAGETHSLDCVTASFCFV